MTFGVERSKNWRWDISPWTKIINRGTLSSNYVVQATKENPKTGEYAFHAWTSQTNTMSFDIQQELVLENPGNYKYQVSVLGGTEGTRCDLNKLNAYAYILVNGTIDHTYDTKIEITDANDGYKDWIYDAGIPYNGIDKLTLGVHIESDETGFWCDIDDCMFNIIHE